MANAPVVCGLEAAHHAHEDAAQPLEGRVAHLAAGAGRKQTQEMLEAVGNSLALGQHSIPLFLDRRFRWHRLSPGTIMRQIFHCP